MYSGDIIYSKIFHLIVAIFLTKNQKYKINFIDKCSMIHNIDLQILNQKTIYRLKYLYYFHRNHQNQDNSEHHLILNSYYHFLFVNLNLTDYYQNNHH